MVLAIDGEEAIQQTGVDGDLPAADPADIAFLQYTSGSTSSPKGVMVTHANLIHNSRAIQTACDHDQLSTFVGWLPVYHDMGLIGNIFQPIYLGAHSVLLSPTAFCRSQYVGCRPSRNIAA